MGGGGVMAHAIHTMKANRKLVGKRKEKRFSFVHTSTEKTEYDLPKATPETLKHIQEKIIVENKKRQQKRLLLIGVFTVILITAFVYIML